MQAHDITLSAGLDIHYFHRSGAGPTLIFLHPSSGYGRMWQETTAYLPAEYNVYALDQRGHGDSSRPDGEYSAEELSRDLKLFIDKLGLQRVSWLAIRSAVASPFVSPLRIPTIPPG